MITVLCTSTACEVFYALLAEITFLMSLIRIGAQEEIEYDDQAPQKHDPTQEHQEKAPDVDVLTIGIGWLQKDEQRGNTHNGTCTYATPHKIVIHAPPGSLQLYCW